MPEDYELSAIEQRAEARFDRSNDIIAAGLVVLIIVGVIGTAIHQSGIALGWWH